MFELVLVYSFLTAACSNPGPSTSATVAIPYPAIRSYTICNVTMEDARWPNDPRCQAVQVPPLCSPYTATEYVKLKVKYPTFKACMKDVARVGERKHLRAICRRVR